ncbi:hypothetical protein [Crenobacter caeni]|uniref:Uncharacterized protein n=1 Tax=Crenobacter caeni TaxID=2705474 RepID=A0A6B2KS81_9NEIS|nr:hypothetical protein [Crenobacter caeni]NDV12984.1 hypothetical protein [Crenobacter caeni]
MYAAWDKLNEAVFGGRLPISNAAEANIDLRNQVAAQDGKVVEVDHSRGSLTSANATKTQVLRGDLTVPLGSVTFNGAAANAERMADIVRSATAGTGLVFQSTHISDPVGAWIGGNSGTGGIPTWDVVGAHGAYGLNVNSATLNKFWGAGKMDLRY